MTPIVISIPGVKLLSSRGSGANSRQHHHAKAREVEQHRHGANAWTCNAISSSNRGAYELRPIRTYKRAIMYCARDDKGRSFPVERVTLTRCCPKPAFCDDGDNLSALFKGTRDGVADALGIDDKVFIVIPNELNVPAGCIGLQYVQEAGPWGIRITLVPAS